MTGIKRKCVVVTDYNTPYAEPWLLHKGDQVTVERKECDWEGWVWCTKQDGSCRWVPESYLDITGSNGRVLKDYDSTELAVVKGEQLTIYEMESEWFWCTDSKGRKGWVPMDNVQLLPSD
jgi:uncharacterized protein YgiM (DUF1202 family)